MIQRLMRILGLGSSSRVPEGWTDDMAVALPIGRTYAEVVAVVVSSALRGTPDTETERLLSNGFDLSPEDAALARDRAFGGLVRSAMQNSAPSRSKDPIAWEGYQRGLADPSLVSQIYPQFDPER